jgi:hypothetical protein
MGADALNFVKVVGNSNSSSPENFLAEFIEIQTFPSAVHLVNAYKPTWLYD